MFFMSNNSEESHVKTFCFTRTLSRYTRAPQLVGLKRPPTEGLATWEPWSWGQICRWTGLCQPAPNTLYHQSPLRTRTAPDLQREIYTDKLERPEEAHGPSLFPPEPASGRHAQLVLLRGPARFPTMNHREHSKWYLSGLHQISCNFCIWQLII